MRACMCACVRRRMSMCAFCSLSSSGFYYLINFIRAHGCVCVWVHAGACVCVLCLYDKGTGMFSLSFWYHPRLKTSVFADFWKTDGRMDKRTDKRTDKRMDRPSYIDAGTHLKSEYCLIKMEAVENNWNTRYTTRAYPSLFDELGSDKVSQQASEQASGQANWQTSKGMPNGSDIAQECSKQHRGSEWGVDFRSC